MIKRSHLFCCYRVLGDYFEHTSPLIHSLNTCHMVITTYMIHKMISDGKNKTNTEFEKIEKNPLDASSKNLLKIKK